MGAEESLECSLSEELQPGRMIPEGRAENNGGLGVGTSGTDRAGLGGAGLGTGQAKPSGKGGSQETTDQTGSSLLSPGPSGAERLHPGGCWL